MNEHDAPATGGRRDFLRRLAMASAAAATTAASFDLSAATPAKRSEVRHWDAATDVLIVGSGAAGIAAAIEARRAGADALVIEKFHIPGGSSSLSGGVCYCGGGTALQKALGFDDSVEAMHDYMTAASGLHASPDKIQLYCENSVAHFDWLVANGVHYAQKFSNEKEISIPDGSLYFSGSERVWPYRDTIKPAPRGHVPPSPHLIGGRDLMAALTASALKLGATLKLKVSAERLIVESDGSISGAIVEEGGKRLNIRARRGVVLAAGGFIHNRPMLERFAPELASCSAPWGRAGDLGIGIQMGMAAGGAVLRMNQGFVVIPIYPPESIVKGIIVNDKGQRFVPEDGYYGLLGHEITFHQNGRAWLIADKDIAFGWDDFRLPVAATADSIDALETKLKMPPGALTQTVDYYNRHAKDGQDPLLHKVDHFNAPLAAAPFTAYDLSVGNVFAPVHTFGGLQTNTDAQVINAFGEVIPGLYAAGRTSAGIPVGPYIGSGVSVGDASYFGRRGGRHAALRTA
ncbi:FAD-dependent oxidoreductase [Solimonas terrae]|uniref:FAD-dependent oxidoreductase n=1 Tax=Solimonas terrae TaxID=1396819 RepID=A0A6M2BRY6_9GAMM|nr:FAD-dependent oxidoreductase [Solimonas terrae]NGY04863.1 FAD-dependent oxidoreductase [Solimonas terrae]